MYKLTKIIIKNTNKTKNLKKEISEFNQQNMSVCDEVSQKNSLKSNLKYFSNNSLTKKSNRRFDNYPSFPVYDVDDDLL